MSSSFSDTRRLKKTGPDTCRQTDGRFHIFHIERSVRTNRNTHQRNFPISHHCWRQLLLPSLVDDVPDLTLGGRIKHTSVKPRLC